MIFFEKKAWLELYKTSFCLIIIATTNGKKVLTIGQNWDNTKFETDFPLTIQMNAKSQKGEISLKWLKENQFRIWGNGFIIIFSWFFHGNPYESFIYTIWFVVNIFHQYPNGIQNLVSKRRVGVMNCKAYFFLPCKSPLFLR